MFFSRLLYPYKVFLVLFFTITCNYVFAGDAALKNWMRQERMLDPYQTGEEIVDTLSAGQWQEGGMHGHFRFVITRYQEGRERLYIQWLKDSGEVAYSLSVKELNKRPNFNLNLPECSNSELCQSVSVDAEHYYEKTTQRFTLTLGAVGAYTFQP